MKTMIKSISKFGRHIFTLAIIMLFTSINLFAQGNGAPIDFQANFLTFTSFVLVVPIVVEFIKRILPKDTSSIAIQIVSWITGVALAMLAWVFNLGFFAEIVIWWEALAVGIGASLVANGIFDTGLITWLLSLVGIKTEKSLT